MTDSKSKMQTALDVDSLPPGLPEGVPILAYSEEVAGAGHVNMNG